MVDNPVVCIARQFGSGGREVGLALAKELDIKFYDRELLQVAAEKSGILHELFEKNDEKPTSGITASYSNFSGIPKYVDYTDFLPNDHLQDIIAEVVTEVADQSPCVIIGRCSDYILRGRKHVMSVFLHAPLEERINRVARLDNLEEDAARTLIRKTDRSRANYYNYHTGRTWGDVMNYHLSIDVCRLSVAKTVQMLKEARSMFCT